MARKLFVSKENYPDPIMEKKWLPLFVVGNPLIPMLIFWPVVAGLAYYSLWVLSIPILSFIAFFALGLVAWTCLEYGGHRFVFHLEAKSQWLKDMVYLIHGAHHDYPSDKRLYLVGPLVSIPAGILFYFIAIWVMGIYGNAFMCGMIGIYVLYDWMHYASHSYNFKNPLFQMMKKHHLRHHFQDPTKGYGFTTKLWDQLLDTDFEEKNASH